MASFMSYFGGRRDPKQSARDAIVTLRQQLQMIEKKEEHLNQRRDAETKTAKDNAVTNKNGELLPVVVYPSIPSYRSIHATLFLAHRVSHRALRHRVHDWY